MNVDTAVVVEQYTIIKPEVNITNTFSSDSRYLSISLQGTSVAYSYFSTLELF